MAQKKKKYIQGIYKPRNKHKYKGDINNIVYRSSYELQFMNYCDNSSTIIEWSSEETVVPYVKPTDGRVHRYFLDFWIKYYIDEFETDLDFWELVDETQYDSEKQQKIKDIKNGANTSITLLKGISEPSPTIGRKSNLYLNTETKDLYIKKEGSILLNPDKKRIRKTKKAIIEIKPFSQTQKPQTQKRITESFKTKVRMFAINSAKWQSADHFAKLNNMDFIIVTERWLKNAR